MEEFRVLNELKRANAFADLNGKFHFRSFDFSFEVGFVAAGIGGQAAWHNALSPPAEVPLLQDPGQFNCLKKTSAEFCELSELLT